ncbi:MAG: PilZ domain-containing protein [Candidatus Latescibacteria bacterium]|nr:PilZ domain-containing protein [Candidatus Latescibacterota bacterium]
MRQYIRHPTDMPIEYDIEDVTVNKDQRLNDIGKGGLSFHAENQIDPGTRIKMRFPIHEPVFETEGIVVWCFKNKDKYQIGVQFSNINTEYHIRMIEQIYFIEQYKNEVLKNEGRELSNKEAAAEWISKYAKDFPRE